jgi:hypothetical protein
MRVISYSLISDLQNFLDEYATLARRFREKSPQFSADAEGWLLKGEAIFKKYNLPDSSKFARLSSAVSAARRGYMHNEKNRNPRSERHFLCWQFLNDGQDIVHRYLAAEQDKFEKAENLLSQLVVIAFQKKILDTEILNQGNGNGVDQIWQTLVKESDFLSGTLHLKALISPVDVLILLDKILDKLKEC